MHRYFHSVVARAGVLGFLALALRASDARASVVDLSVSGGVVKRSLSTTNFDPGAVVEASVELGVIPSVLYLGPYFNFAQLAPKLAVDAGTPSSSKFYGFGFRARAVLPLPIPVHPYALAGAGLVHANFPDQIVHLCAPQVGSFGGLCADETLPNATANFVELALGTGIRFDPSEHVRFFIEGAWKPTFGYQNDTWENAAHGSKSSGGGGVPTPSRNGYAFSASLGVMASF